MIKPALSSLSGTENQTSSTIVQLSTGGVAIHWQFEVCLFPSHHPPLPFPHGTNSLTQLLKFSNYLLPL